MGRVVMKTHYICLGRVLINAQIAASAPNGLHQWFTLSKYTFTAVIGHRPHPVVRVTLRPRGGMPLYIEPR